MIIPYIVTHDGHTSSLRIDDDVVHRSVRYRLILGGDVDTVKTRGPAHFERKRPEGIGGELREKDLEGGKGLLIIDFNGLGLWIWFIFDWSILLIGGCESKWLILLIGVVNRKWKRVTVKRWRWICNYPVRSDFSRDNRTRRIGEPATEERTWKDFN